MTRTQQLRILIRLAGAAAVAALIWLAGPFVRIGDAHPLEDQAPRLVAILSVFLLVAGSGAYRLAQRWKSARRIARGISADDKDSPALAERMQEALAALRRAKGGLAYYLFDLPWYILIGSPDSGKATAILNSGLAFPLATGGAQSAIAGVAAARHCDWWFTEDAVLIDASGLYAARDSDAKADKKSWLALLSLLKRYRPRQPINGVLVTISLEDLLARPQAEAAAHAAAIRSSLIELGQRLDVDLPVYVLFTKADLVLGFREFFDALDESGRAQVWGATFQPTHRTKSTLARISAEYDALVLRLNKSVAGRLAEEKDPAKRALLFGFPAQMEALRPRVAMVLNKIFDSAQEQINAALRGFYFTSGTQQGAPIDPLLGALTEGFGAEPAGTPAYSGQRRSFFLNDLFEKVVIGEAGWVSSRRGGWTAELAAYASLLVVASLILGAWWMSYAKNSARIAQSKEAAAKYSAVAAGLGESDIVSDHDLGKALPALHALRFLPGGFASDRAAAASASGGFGLNQAARLKSAADAAYSTGLERLLRPRLLYRLEEELAAKSDEPAARLEALKVYLMLGGLETADRPFLIAWLQRDWSQNLYPGAKNAEGRKELEQHVIAMLDLEDGRAPRISLNGPLVEKTQAALARVNVAERAYQLLAARAKAGLGDDWTASKSGGAGARPLFDNSIETIRAPYFLTKSGFEHAFMDRLAGIGEEMARDRRVLGAAGERPAISAQYDRLQQDLVDIYVKAFIGAWRGAIDKLKLRRLTAERPAYPLLAAAASSASPIARLLESIRDETLLPEAEPKLEAAEGSEPAPETAPIVGTAGETPARMIDAALQPYHRLVEGEPGRRPIDGVISELNEIRADLSRLAAAGAPADELIAKIAGGVERLKTDASMLPQPFANMMIETADAVTGEIGDLTVARIVETLRSAVTPACQERIASRFPFVHDAKREVGLDDFVHIFGPKGLIDQFASEHILPAADTSGPEWKWREGGPLAKRLGASTLADFQRAAEIRDAFFTAADPAKPGFAFSVTPPSLSAAKLDIHGTIITAQGRKTAAATLQWPGPANNQRVTLAFRAGRRPPAPVERTGVWAIYRLIDAGRSSADGAATTFSLGGQELDYRFESRPASPSAALKPLNLTQLRKFRCPHGS